MCNKNKILILLVAVTTGVLIAHLVFADEGALSTTKSTDVSGTEKSNFIKLLDFLFKATLSAAGFLAVLMIILGGLQYITAAGSVEQINRAKNFITQAIYGLLLAACSWLILYTINPDFIKLEMPKLELEYTSTDIELKWYLCKTTSRSFETLEECQKECPDPEKNCSYTSTSPIEAKCDQECGPGNWEINTITNKCECKTPVQPPIETKTCYCVSNTECYDECPPNKTCMPVPTATSYDCSKISF
ncbi:MAG: pilin [Promethearchaeota archaeon]